MNTRIKFALVPAVIASLLIFSSDGWTDTKWPQDAKSRAGRCESRWMGCGAGCDQLIDIGSTVANCKKECDARHGRCLIWASKGTRIMQ